MAGQQQIPLTLLFEQGPRQPHQALLQFQPLQLALRVAALAPEVVNDECPR